MVPTYTVIGSDSKYQLQPTGVMCDMVSTYTVMSSLHPDDRLSVGIIDLYNDSTYLMDAYAGDLPYQLLMYTTVETIDTDSIPIGLLLRAASAYRRELYVWLLSDKHINRSIESADISYSAFMAFETVHRNNDTDIFDVEKVCRVAGISRAEYTYIITHYTTLHSHLPVIGGNNV